MLAALDIAPPVLLPSRFIELVVLRRAERASLLELNLPPRIARGAGAKLDLNKLP